VKLSAAAGGTGREDVQVANVHLQDLGFRVRAEG
jgi:hypothetical protein